MKEPHDLKEFRKTYGTKPLTFVKPDELADILGLIPGAVSPFGLLNDVEKKDIFFIDEAFKSGSGHFYRMGSGSRLPVESPSGRRDVWMHWLGTK